MTGQPAARPREVSRRRFLRLAGAAAGLISTDHVGKGWVGNASAETPLHRPVLRLPASTSNGAKVPIVVEVPHPMQADHHITSIRVVNERDPVPSKGVYHLTPANGEAYLAFQARLDDGVSTVAVIAECNRHGRFTSERSITIPPGGGGCAGGAPPRLENDEIGPPVIRIPRLIAYGHIAPHDTIAVQLKIRHPVRTGLALREGKFVQESEPLYLDTMEVFYGGEQVSRFALTSALSDNPFITFKLRAHREAALRVVLTNTRGRRFEATQPIRFG